MRLYRYETITNTTGTFLICYEYLVAKETKCYYITNSGKRVKKNAKRPYACNIKEEALDAFIARTKNYVKILENNLVKAKCGLGLAIKMKKENKK